MFQRFLKLNSENRVIGIREGSYTLEDKHPDEISLSGPNQSDLSLFMHCIFTNGQLIDDEVARAARQRDKEQRDKEAIRAMQATHAQALVRLPNGEQI